MSLGPSSQKKWDQLLVFAVRERLHDKMREALAAGANVNVKHASGYTPLMIAVLNGDSYSVKTLKESGADLEAVSAVDGYTALMLAVNSDLKRNRDDEIVDILLEGNPDIGFVW